MYSAFLLKGKSVMYDVKRCELGKERRKKERLDQIVNMVGNSQLYAHTIKVCLFTGD